MFKLRYCSETTNQGTKFVPLKPRHLAKEKLSAAVDPQNEAIDLLLHLEQVSDKLQNQVFFLVLQYKKS